MDRLIDAMAGNWFWTVLGLIATAGIVFGAIKSMVLGSARERSRREIAAYIAEGSMTPEQGERLMRASNNEEEC